MYIYIYIYIYISLFSNLLYDLSNLSIYIFSGDAENEAVVDTSGFHRVRAVEPNLDTRTSTSRFIGHVAGLKDDSYIPTEPVDAYETFMTKDVVKFIVDCTNKRAKVFLETNNRRKVHGLVWKDVTVADIYTYLALVKLMGLIK